MCFVDDSDFWDERMKRGGLEMRPRHPPIGAVGRRNDHDTVLANPVCEPIVRLRIHESPGRIDALVQLCGTHHCAALAYPVPYLAKDQIDSFQLAVPVKPWRLMLFKVGL